MTSKIIISEAAYTDLDDIFSYIAGNLASPAAAGKLIDKIFDSIEKLSYFPLMGVIPDNDVLNAKGYRILPVNNFVIFYIVKSEEVHIVRIVYGRRDFDALFN